MTATTKERFVGSTGRVLEAGESVKVVNVYKKEAVVENDRGWLFRIDKRILTGIPKNAPIERG